MKPPKKQIEQKTKMKTQKKRESNQWWCWMEKKCEEKVGERGNGIGSNQALMLSRIAC